MPLQVITGRRAKRDIFREVEFLAKESATSAERWLDGIEKAIQSLALLPERYGIAVEFSDPPRVIREFLYGKRGREFRIYYEVVGNRVHVKHVRNARRDELTEEELIE